MQTENDLKPIVEGDRFPVFIEDSQTDLRWDRFALRIGNHGQGESQKTTLSLSQARLLAYELLREVEDRLVKIERMNEESRRLNAAAERRREQSESNRLK